MNLFIETPECDSQRRERRWWSDPPQLRPEPPAKREASIPSPVVEAADATGAVARRRGRRFPKAPEGACFSVAQETYEEERAYSRRRAHAKKLLHVLSIVGMLILLPVVVVAVFLGSYALTCIANGATPRELTTLFQELFSRVAAFIAGLGAAS